MIKMELGQTYICTESKVDYWTEGKEYEVQLRTGKYPCIVDDEDFAWYEYGGYELTAKFKLKEETAMKKYLIYTTNSTEPFVVHTEQDLIDEFSYALSAGEQSLYIEHKKDLIGLGTYEYQVMLNMNNIVSITTSEKA